jgi:hypothetical protein
MIDSAAVAGAQIVDPVLIGCRSVAKPLVVVKKDGFRICNAPPACCYPPESLHFSAMSCARPATITVIDVAAARKRIR